MSSHTHYCCMNLNFIIQSLNVMSIILDIKVNKHIRTVFHYFCTTELYTHTIGFLPAIKAIMPLYTPLLDGVNDML